MAPPNRPADLPKSTNDTACFFFWLQNPRDCILLLVDISWWKIPLIFVPSQRIGNRWTSDEKREFSRWFWFKWKVRQSGRFLAWKTSEKRLFYRLKRNYFTFRLFGMLHRKVSVSVVLYRYPCRFPTGRNDSFISLKPKVSLAETFSFTKGN